MHTDEIHRLQWAGLEIAVHYCPDWSLAYRSTYGYALAQLQVSAPCPLPISETGFRSLFERADTVAAKGGPGPYVFDWLEQAALDPEWIAAQDAARQLSLF